MDYAAIAYATVVAAGGIMGYVKKGSLVSAAMGLAFGGILGTIRYHDLKLIQRIDNYPILSLKVETENDVNQFL